MGLHHIQGFIICDIILATCLLNAERYLCRGISHTGQCQEGLLAVWCCGLGVALHCCKVHLCFFVDAVGLTEGGMMMYRVW